MVIVGFIVEIVENLSMSLSIVLTRPVKSAQGFDVGVLQIEYRVHFQVYLPTLPSDGVTSF
jgi:hypothetical protein